MFNPPAEDHMFWYKEEQQSIFADEARFTGRKKRLILKNAILLFIKFNLKLWLYQIHYKSI